MIGECVCVCVPAVFNTGAYWSYGLSGDVSADYLQCNFFGAFYVKFLYSE